jgi:hypothetical protein
MLSITCFCITLSVTILAFTFCCNRITFRLWLYHFSYLSKECLCLKTLHPSYWQSSRKSTQALSALYMLKELRTIVSDSCVADFILRHHYELVAEFLLQFGIDKYEGRVFKYGQKLGNQRVYGDQNKNNRNEETREHITSSTTFSYVDEDGYTTVA